MISSEEGKVKIEGYSNKVLAEYTLITHALLSHLTKAENSDSAKRIIMLAVKNAMDISDGGEKKWESTHAKKAKLVN